MRFALIFILFFTLSGAIKAQTEYGLWTGISTNVPVSKDIKLTFEGQSRFDNNVSRMNRTFLSSGFKWNVHSHFRIAFDYRLSSVPFSSSESNRIATHRYCIDAELRNMDKFFAEKSRFDLDFRLRGTSEYEKNKRTDYYIRSRLNAAYDIKKTKLTPSVSAELFYHINDRIIYTFTEVKTKNRIDRMRLTGTLEYPLTKRQDVSVFGIYQPQFYEGKTDLIFGVGYTYNFKKKKS